MSAAVVGVLGPADLVEVVTGIGEREFGRLQLRPVPYRHENDTVALIRGATPDIEAWLFTGVIPYSLAQHAGVLHRPATHIDYTGATLYRALVERLASGSRWESASIDTLRRADVLDAFREAGLPTARVRVREYRAARDAATFADFHRGAARDPRTSLAISCVRSVYDEISTSIPALRLAPAASSVRSALQAVSLICDSAFAADAQVAIGIVELAAPSVELGVQARRLAGVTVPVSDTRHLLVTTRGVLAEATSQFRDLPLLDTLRREQPRAHVGFGVGRTAAAAEALARRALTQAAAAGRYAAVVSFGPESELVLASPAPQAPTRGEPVSLAVAERRSGVSQTSLRRILQAAGEQPDATVTAAGVARSLAIEDRSARRILERLVRAGVADARTSPPGGTVGRPPKSYYLKIG